MAGMSRGEEKGKALETENETRNDDYCSSSIVHCAAILVFICGNALAQQPRNLRTMETDTETVPNKRAFELIGKSPLPIGWNEPNPVAVVRAVNYLHSLGKEKSIEVLHAYIKQCPRVANNISATSGRRHRECEQAHTPKYQRQFSWDQF
jgi:hypothetical protein